MDDSVILGLEVARPAQDAVPVPPVVRYQVYGIADGLITSITGYTDIESARGLGITLST